jgi:hypothetical protein
MGKDLLIDRPWSLSYTPAVMKHTSVISSSSISIVYRSQEAETSILCSRFLFGAGESGAYPNSSRAIAHWFPDFVESLYDAGHCRRELRGR